LDAQKKEKIGLKELKDLIRLNPAPEPWSEGEKIPWDDPEFSQRMLQEHLSQDHDLASRRIEKIDQHVHWIHETLLNCESTRILDLGCGPGFYTNRLAKLGHTATGIDFSPASIDYARQVAGAERLTCEYKLADIRHVEYGSGYGLVMMLYGEFNTFRPSEARSIIQKICRSLASGGILLLEVSCSDAIYDLGQEPPTWYAVPSGLFSDRPHICLMEKFYDGLMAVTTERYLIIDVETAYVTRYASSLQTYTHSDFQNMLGVCEYQQLDFHSNFGEDHTMGEKFFLVVCKKQGNSLSV
jgi:SAM-dependent methyltransferase